MQMKKETIFLLCFLLLIAAALIVVSVFNNDISAIFLKNDFSQEKKPPLPTYKPVNISTTLHATRGTVTLNAHVPESLAAMPVYRQNMSVLTDIVVDRQEVVRKYNRDTTNISRIIDLLPPESEVPSLAEKYLQPYGGIPDDAVFEKMEKSPDIHYYYPNTSSPYVRVYYNQSLAGYPVIWRTIYNDRPYDENHVLEMDIGMDRELIRLKKRWVESEFIQVEPVMPIEEALKKLEQGVNVVDSYGGKWSLNVTGIRQGYMLDTRDTTIIEPVWIFSGINQYGHNQELSVPARRNGSATLPMYNYSHREGPIPESPFDTLRHYEGSASGRYIRIPLAVDTVRNFSANPDLLVTSSEPVDEKGGEYGGIYRIYHINTSEGMYRVDAGTGKIASVYYHQTKNSSGNGTLTFHQVIEKSHGYIDRKFGNHSVEYLASHVHITEQPGHFGVMFPVSNRLIRLDIDNQSGSVLNYYDYSAAYPICNC